MELNKIDHEKGWATIQSGFDMVVSFIESHGVNPNNDQPFLTSHEYMLLYTIVYNLCLKEEWNCEIEICNRYKYLFQAYINTRVYEKMKGEIISAVLSMINEDRDGKPIDGDLVKGVIKIFSEIKLNNLDSYQKDFEPAFLESSGLYYDQNFLACLSKLSHSNYMLKVDECLNIESFKGSQYLHPRIRFESAAAAVQNKLTKMVNQA